MLKFRYLLSCMLMLTFARQAGANYDFDVSDHLDPSGTTLLFKKGEEGELDWWDKLELK
ncbi:MAG: hypothetical protein U9N07_06820 [Euryarchaeota archaeon]|nr:hypothetical protein [Euryarchaeota archaeon]